MRMDLGELVVHAVSVAVSIACFIIFRYLFSMGRGLSILLCLPAGWALTLGACYGLALILRLLER